jgi:hypothetical protein
MPAGMEHQRAGVVQTETQNLSAQLPPLPFQGCLVGARQTCGASGSGERYVTQCLFQLVFALIHLSPVYPGNSADLGQRTFKYQSHVGSKFLHNFVQGDD